MGKWTVIGTWSMVLRGVKQAADILQGGGRAADAVIKAIMATEDYRGYTSVGFGGLPNAAGVVELDAGFMDGDTFAVGAVGAVKDFKNPILIAQSLSGGSHSNFLVGQGAEDYACSMGFSRKNMLTPKAKARWLKQINNNAPLSGGHSAISADQPGTAANDATTGSNEDGQGSSIHVRAYDGHDTVCVVALDSGGSVVAGTSTSGLFMKRPGRLGDTALVGSGFYADSAVGGAAATGMGEEIMKGCLSYEAVRRMERGMTPAEAAESCVREHADKLRRLSGDPAVHISLICLDKEGRFGAGTTLRFPYVAASDDLEPHEFILF